MFKNTYFEEHLRAAASEGNHIIGYSYNGPLKPATTVLAIMIAPMMGAPAFACRLIPVYSLKHELFDQRLRVINSIHQNNGFVFLLISENLMANQAYFKMYQKNYGSDKIFACNNRILIEALKSLYLLYDPMHLLKNI